MDEFIIKNAHAYALQHRLRIAERLGFGIHGIVFGAKNNSNEGRSAIKVHRAPEPFERACAVYEQLRLAGVSKILGFHVPELLGVDKNSRVIELTIVSRPFVLDFAGAYLDFPPQFPVETWSEWEAEKRDQFEDRWPVVQAVLGVLEEFDSHMIDVSRSNLAFP